MAKICTSLVAVLFSAASVLARPDFEILDEFVAQPIAVLDEKEIGGQVGERVTIGFDGDIFVEVERNVSPEGRLAAIVRVDPNTGTVTAFASDLYPKIHVYLNQLVFDGNELVALGRTPQPDPYRVQLHFDSVGTWTQFTALTPSGPNDTTFTIGIGQGPVWGEYYLTTWPVENAGSSVVTARDWDGNVISNQLIGGRLRWNDDGVVVPPTSAYSMDNRWTLVSTIWNRTQTHIVKITDLGNAYVYGSAQHADVSRRIRHDRLNDELYAEDCCGRIVRVLPNGYLQTFVNHLSLRFDFDISAEGEFFLMYGNTLYRFSAIDVDLNDDGVIDTRDLLILLAHWGPCNDDPCVGDIDFSGDVGVVDLLYLLERWS